MYLTTNQKFLIAFLGALLWALFATWISQFWYPSLVEFFTPIGAIVILLAIAIFPGFMNAFVIFSLLLDKRPKLNTEIDYHPEISILIAAYNEAHTICDTIQSVLNQEYENLHSIIVVDDGSTDNTASVVKENFEGNSLVRVVVMPHNSGKASALNVGLKLVETPLFVSVDADCYLYKNSLNNLVFRYLSDPPSAAIAGAVLVRNSRENIITKIQEWDYFHGIAAVKRIQSLYQGTLVAQGAYTLYETEIVRELGGWKRSVGEDIVLTWEMLNAGHRVGYAENACAFTNAPTTWKGFFRQRERWARGIFEAIKYSPGVLLKPRKTLMFIWWNVSFVYIDFIYTFVFIPGLIAALFGNFLIAGPITLLVLPLGLIINYVMFKRSHSMFTEQGLRVRSNIIGFILYGVAYNMLLQPASTMGYIKEMLSTKKTWGTK